MAPELLDPDSFGLKFVRTPATDVYAFGCVCFEVLILLKFFLRRILKLSSYTRIDPRSRACPSRQL